MVKYAKEKPYKFAGDISDILNISFFVHLGITNQDYLSYRCKDCGKEVNSRVVSIRTFHSKVLKGKKDPCQDDLLCKSCKIKRKYRKDYNVDNPQQLSYVQKANKTTFFKNHPNHTPFSEDPIRLEMTWDEFKRSSRSFTIKQKLSYRCTDCGKECITTYGNLRTRKLHGVNSGFYCKKCSVIHSKEITEEALSKPLFEGKTLEEFEIFKKENNLTIDDYIRGKCSLCGNDFILMIRNLRRRNNHLDLCDDCYMSVRLDEMSILGSKAEENIYSYLTTDLGLQVIRHNRNIIPPQEIDLFIPSLNIGIEYNGKYWHKDKPKYYHQEKSLKCRDQGIRLIQFYEADWDLGKIKEYLKSIIEGKEDISKSILSLDYDNCLGISGKITEPTYHEKGGYWDSGTLIRNS